MKHENPDVAELLARNQEAKEAACCHRITSGNEYSCSVCGKRLTTNERLRAFYGEGGPFERAVGRMERWPG